jgi:hypothetical protein
VKRHQDGQRRYIGGDQPDSLAVNRVSRKKLRGGKVLREISRGLSECRSSACSSVTPDSFGVGLPDLLGLFVSAHILPTA